MSKLDRKIKATNGLDLYLELVELTEPPLIFHRWSFISAVAACLGRQVWLPFGEWKIYPNFYTTLIGPPGARKGVAIGTISELLRESGYQYFSGDRSSKEKFMADWEFGFDKINRGAEPDDKNTNSGIDMVDEVLTPAGRDTTKVSEVFIKAGELEDFLGSGNSNFISTLTNLWDNLPYYTDRFKNSKSLYIPNPTVNMLGGATTTTFASIFSTNIIGQGMLSRMLLIHGKGQRLRLTIPPPLPPDLKVMVIDLLRTIRATLYGEIGLEKVAYDALDFIYNNFAELPDARFASYSSRRFTHLLKLCIIVAACDLRTTITLDDVIFANTILTYTEKAMPTALGEFGKSRNSEVANVVLDEIRNSAGVGGITIRELFAKVSQDVDTTYDLSNLCMKLAESGKIKKGTKDGDVVLLPVEVKLGVGNQYVNFNLLWEVKLDSF